MDKAIGQRRERTRKEGKCQLCERKTPLKEQYTVTNDLKAGIASKRKDGTRKAAEEASHYCEECVEKRVKQKQAWLNARAKRLAKGSA
jgi:hypothetical protein